jgi:acetylornithine deacetylase/succinyl-diaminopimelate desuccinylase-like protein
MLMGHTDVVPVNPDTWERDPFGGELVDGLVWGRGAVDMLNLTASMAVTCKRLMTGGFAPKGDLVYFAVADEEAGGEHGAKWYVDHEPDQVRTDYVLTEFGGMRLALPGRDEPALAVGVAEKGPFWGRMRITGEPGHASLPYRSDNALVTAAEVVRRLAGHRTPAVITETWRAFVEGLDYDADVSALMTDPEGVESALELVEDLGMARFVHGCTHMTIAPTMMDAGMKSNMIPGEAQVTFDVRVLPGQDRDDVETELRAALGDLADAVSWEFEFADAGSSDSRFLRQLGATCYGYGLYSERIPLSDFAAMFHGNNERVDQHSLDLTTQLWMRVVQDLLA